MRLLHKISAWIMVAGLLLIMGSGFHVRGGADGTWVHVNLVNAVGGVALLCGVVLSVVAAFASGRAGAEPEKRVAVDPSEAHR